ncbi:hypothetical protein AGABI2DRAFT_122323 [Agaricus bisporus var. bisporus H97]|uniref:hypothetical protein n=1 Tax=Agaricus bisporus var. bisporus (strain H97 / ATCC MYA-4626 / FGSC 10389) TaxID=936046 RepID=UPI00029F68B0|nr:hypothetical protein AGABI2DRAFT_122323 [Agaricus bisporus var. bisporus H97]EKV42739.1 hypothetical protein AGABI2DRAFT_122323 [Agaricus bisporus var. bisporus H97]
MSKNDVTQSSIKPIDKTSVHRITSGQVVIDIQTAVKELIENSLDAGATNIDVRFKQYGLTSIEVVDNGSGIAEKDHEVIGLKHHTSKLSTYTDLAELHTFGFRGEALSSLCALCQSVQVTTSTQSPVGYCLDLDAGGRIKSQKTVARPKGTTVTLKGLFQPLPVRRKELERNIKREFAKALGLLNAYALLPCTVEPGIRLNVSNQPDKGAKSQVLTTQGTPSMRASVSTLWGPKALDNVVDLDLRLEVERERGNKRTISQALPLTDDEPLQVRVRGLISKFSVSCGRTGTDRQFFYVNGRPCTLNKVQKAFNEVYRSFNPNQSAFIVADFVIPTAACDVNVSPDKRTIFLHSESNLIAALKEALERNFNPERSTFEVTSSQAKTVQTTLNEVTQSVKGTTTNTSRPCHHSDSSDDPTEDSTISTSSPTIISTSSTNDNCSDQPSIAASKVPLFIPDPDDDIIPESVVEAPRNLGRELPIPHLPERSGHRDDQNQEIDQEVVIDTTRASWNRQLPSSPATMSKQRVDNDQSRQSERQKDFLQESDPAEAEGHPRKKHKCNTETLIPWLSVKPTSSTQKKSRIDLEVTGSASLARPTTVPEKVRQGKLTMHNFLSGFASQPTDDSQNDGSLDVEDVEDAEVENDEEEGERVEIAEDTEERSDDEMTVEQSVITPSPEVVTRVGKESNLSVANRDVGDDVTQVEDLDTLMDLSPAKQKHLASIILEVNETPQAEIIRSGGDNDVALRFDTDQVRSHWCKIAESASTHRSTLPHEDLEGLKDAGLSNTNNEDKAAEVLSRIIDKSDFSEMELVGQFNHGFIITRRRKLDSSSSGVMDDLFIVDQHAADEKYNFETLQQTTNIQSQTLFRSRPLELTASEELVATENIDILRKNGFEVDVNETALPGNRLILTAQPVSKSTVFDAKDLEELINLMQDRPNGSMVRCSKARAMFAMRACRKSVMIGTSLNRHQMLNIVRHMGTIDQPWNCPHGRPTMRHLADLWDVERQKKKVDWVRLITAL